VLKRPADGDFRVQHKHGGSAVVAQPPPALLSDALAAMSMVNALGLGHAMYARVDGVAIDGRLVVMELELLEPQLFFGLHPAGGLRFARQLAHWLRVGSDAWTSIGL
jgi:hypothetical protein